MQSICATKPSLSDEREYSELSGSGSGRWRFYDSAAIAILCMGVAAVFGGTLRYSLTNWDDFANVINNPYLRPVCLENLAKLWTAPYKGLYIPVVYSSFALDILVGGQRIWVFHLVNVILHSASVCLVYLILRRVLCKEGAMPAWHPVAGLAGTVLFAVHPLQVEAVAWVTGRKDLLAGVLSLCSLLWYLMSTGGRRGRVWRSFSFVAFILALLSKPSAAAMPAAAFALEWLALGVCWRTVLLRLAPFLVCSVAFSVYTTGFVQTVPDRLAALLPPLWTRPLVAADSLVFYLQKLVCPMDLCPIYGRTPVFVMAESHVYLKSAGVIVLGILVGRLGGVPLASALIYVLLLAPVSGIVPFFHQRLSTVADRYVYLAMVGPALAIAHWTAILLGSCWGTRKLVVGLVFLVMGLFGVTACLQCRIWRNALTVWPPVIRAAPGLPEAHMNLGLAYLKIGHTQEAETELIETLRLSPDLPEVYTGLASLRLRQGRYQAAMEALETAIDLNPASSASYEALGLAFADQGTTEEAIALLQRAAELDPANSTVHLPLAVLYEQCGMKEESKHHLELGTHSAFDARQVAIHLRQLREGDFTGYKRKPHGSGID